MVSRLTFGVAKEFVGESNKSPLAIATFSLKIYNKENPWGTHDRHLRTSKDENISLHSERYFEINFAIH
jgi:hypothetical protein